VTVPPILPDVPPPLAPPAGAPDASALGGAGPGGSATFAGALGEALDQAERALEGAASAERDFVAGRGGLQEMVLERARADVALSVATAAASRASQALSTVLGMQI
jgi:flagellar hook-basal body complex protein FliE